MVSHSSVSSQAGDRKVACVMCRRRKIACDRNRPSCGFCTTKKFHCEYVSSDRQPGVRAGYVAQLEQRLALLEERVSRVEVHVPSQSSTDREPVEVDHSFDDGYALPDANLPGSSNSSEHPQGAHMLPGSLTSNDTAPPPVTPLLPLGNGFHPDNSPRTNGILPANLFEVQTRINMCDLWFEKYHHWFPILHRPTLSQCFEGPFDLNTSSRRLVLQAIAAITVEHTQYLPPGQLQQAQSHLSSSIMLEAMNTPSLDSIQALLILSVMHYGQGQTTQTWNLLAMCRRMGVSVGLRELVDKYGGTATTSPGALALQRMTSIAYTTIEHEELVRAYWMTEMLDSISNIGAKHELGFLSAPSNPLLPCSDTMWTQPADVIGEVPLRPSNYSSAFSLCVVLALNELQMVHNFLRKPVAMAVFEERDSWQSEAQRIDERLTVWRDEFVAAVYRLINAEKTHAERPEMDPFFVLTNCVLNTAVITLLQPRAPCPPGIEKAAESWAFASNRCIYACENMAYKVRQMTEDEMLFCNPHLVFSIFVAARFYIVHSKALDADVPVNLHSLAFALHVCGKRWSLAQSFEAIIRVAVAEYRTPIAHSKVPREFYDLQYSTLEIADDLKAWAAGLTPDVPLELLSGIGT